MHRATPAVVSFIVWGLWGLLVAAAQWLPTSVAAAPNIHLEIGAPADDGMVELEESFTVTVFASEIPVGSDGNGLFAAGFALGYDPAVLVAADPVLGPFWSGTGFEVIRNEPGSVGFTSARFFEPNGPSGDFILLGTIDFNPVGPGLTALALGHFTGSGDNVLFDGTVLDTDPVAFFEAPTDIEVTHEVPSVSAIQAGLLALGLALSGIRQIGIRQIARSGSLHLTRS